MHQLKHTGLRYGDTCRVVSPWKNCRKISLNRTCWDILPESDTPFSKLPVIGIPGAKPRSFRWRLELQSIEGEPRFLLKSIDGSPFVLNGQWSREAFVEGADTLGLEKLGRLEFCREAAQNDFLPPQWPEVLKDERVLKSSLPILIFGETGTGKSHLAQEIHRRSERTGEFVMLNMSSVAESLLESELFGHRRGSFTGAVKDRAGALASARGGTLFLDEVDSLSKEIQVKLLHFLDHGKFRAVGGDREEMTNARLIFASGRPLTGLVKAGVIRSDLYFRMSQGVTVGLDNLRDHPHSIVKHCQLFAIEEKVSLSQRLIDFYTTLPWPGNVRQLRGHLFGKKVRSKTGKLDFDESDEKLLVMSSDLMGMDQVSAMRMRTIDEVKREYARAAYRHNQGQLYKTAKELKVNPKTLKLWVEEKSVS